VSIVVDIVVSILVAGGEHSGGHSGEHSGGRWWTFEKQLAFLAAVQPCFKKISSSEHHCVHLCR